MKTMLNKLDYVSGSSHLTSSSIKQFYLDNRKSCANIDHTENCTHPEIINYYEKNIPPLSPTV